MLPFHFNPNDHIAKDKLLGLPFTEENAALIVLPVPWDATASYGKGTAYSSNQILRASQQIDLYDEEFPELPWKKGIYMLSPNDAILKENMRVSTLIADYLCKENYAPSPDLAAINTACDKIKEWVRAQCKYYFQQGKKVLLLGGEHSVSFGYYEALAEWHDSFGILHIDAHLDLRRAYCGLTHSHASIMYNILNKVPALTQLCSVGIRDYCEEERDVVRAYPEKIRLFTEQYLQYGRFEGKLWQDNVAEIVSCLPEKVALSLDIDGLEPSLCPHTGTPVLGGRTAYELFYLLRKIRESGRRIIACDIVETGYCDQDEWDANVAARMLFKIGQYLLTDKN